MERYKAAKSLRANWEDLYRDAQDYFCPQHQTFDEHAPGQHKQNEDFIFDSTAQESLMSFASNLQSSLVPPMKRWTRLSIGPGIEATKQNKAQLERIEEFMFAGLRVSNFDTQVASSFMNLALGTAALLVFKGDVKRPFRFVSVPLSQLYLEEGVDGRIDTAFRDFKMRYDRIEDNWEDAKLTPEMLERCENESGDNKQVKLIDGSYPSRVTIMREGRGIEVDGYVYEVYLDGFDEPIVRREELTSPWVIYRWSNVPGEVYGRGPALIALADVKSLNETKRILLETSSIQGLGIYTALEDDIINLENVKLEGGTFIPVSSNEGGVNGRSISPLPPAGNVNLSQMVIRDLQESIRKVMFGNPLGDVNLPVKTATEISIRQQDLAKRIGSAFGKLQYEFLAPLIKRLIDILYELGFIETDATFVNGSEINIEYQSPLAQAQDEEDISRIMRFIEMSVGVMGAEQAGMVIKLPNAYREMARLMNLPSDMVVTEEEAEKIKEQMMAIMQQMQAGQGNEQATQGNI